MTLRGKYIYFLSCGSSESKLPSLFETYPTYQYHMEQRNQVTDTEQVTEEQVFHPSLAPGRDAILTRNRERVFRPKNFYDSLVSGALSTLSTHHPPSVWGGEHSVSFLTGIFIPRDSSQQFVGVSECGNQYALQRLLCYQLCVFTFLFLYIGEPAFFPVSLSVYETTGLLCVTEQLTYGIFSEAGLTK